MNSRIPRWLGCGADGPRMGIIAGIGILLAVGAHFPAGWDALNYFDPPKRLVWALLLLVLAANGRAPESHSARGLFVSGLVLLAWMVGRTLARPDPTVEWEVLVIWCLPLACFLLALGANRGQDFRWLGQLLVLAGALQGILMVLQRVGWDPLFAETTAAMVYKPGRMVGTLGYHNQAVDFLVLSVVGAMWAFRNSYLRWGYGILALGVAGLAGNRGGILAFLAAGTVAATLAWGVGSPRTMRKSRVLLRVALGGAIMLGGVWLVPETSARFRELFTQMRDSPAVQSRLYMDRIAVDLLRERPGLGWGAGEYAFQYLDRLGAVLPEVKTHRIMQSVVFAREAHNDPLQFAAEFGGIGVVLLLALVGRLVVSAWKARKASPEAWVGTAFVLTYMAVSSLFSFPWQTSVAGPLAGLLLGWAVTAPHDAPEPRERTMALRGRKGGRIFGWAMCGLLAAWFGAETAWNVVLPLQLSGGDVSGAERMLPSWAHRYHALVGAAYAERKDWADAERELEWAHSGFRDVVLWNNLGHVYAQTGQWTKALEIYSKWSACGLDHADALENLSIAHEQLGQTAAAATALRTRAVLFPRLSIDEIKRLAILQFQSGDWTGAEQTLGEYSRIWTGASAETVATFANLIGAVALAQGNRDAAVFWFQSALERNPGLASARRNLEQVPAAP